MAEQELELCGDSAMQRITFTADDLSAIAFERYYHPEQRGSWSIKRVLPAVAPDLRYDGIDGVQDGGGNASRPFVARSTIDPPLL